MQLRKFADAKISILVYEQIKDSGLCVRYWLFFKVVTVTRHAYS